jgi:hypothetical protein
VWSIQDQDKHNTIEAVTVALGMGFSPLFRLGSCRSKPSLATNCHHAVSLGKGGTGERDAVMTWHWGVPRLGSSSRIQS